MLFILKEIQREGMHECCALAALNECSSRKRCKNVEQPGGSAAGKGARMWCSLKGLQQEGVQECGAAWRDCSRKGCKNVVQPGGSAAGRDARMWCRKERVRQEGMQECGATCSGSAAERGARMWCSLEGVQQEGVQECGAAWKI
jgi:hypothetical protein